MKSNGAFSTKSHFYNLLHANYLIVNIRNMSLIFVKYIHTYEGGGRGGGKWNSRLPMQRHMALSSVYIRLSWLRP